VLGVVVLGVVLLCVFVAAWSVSVPAAGRGGNWKGKEK
jgi:hypothetical protein